MSAADKCQGGRRGGKSAFGGGPGFRPIAGWAAFHTNSFGLRREPGLRARRPPVKEDAQLNRHRLPFRLTVGTGIPSFRDAADRLPASAILTASDISSTRSMDTVSSEL